MIVASVFEIELAPAPPLPEETVVVPVGADGLSTLKGEPTPFKPSKSFYDLSSGDMLWVNAVPRQIMAIQIIEDHRKTA